MGKKRNSLPPFVPVFREMLRSEAWGNLTNAARVAYIHLKGKCVSFHQDEVTLSFKEMERIMDRHTFHRATVQLLENGFITISKRGGLHRKRNYYSFTEQWKNIQKGQKQVLISTPSTVGISTPSRVEARK